MLLVFGGLMYFIIKEGEARQIQEAISVSNEAPHDLKEGFFVFKDLLMHHVESSIGILLLQIIVILITCRLFGWLFAKMQQPTVIGEIVAGIVLGPSVLGHLLPSVSAFLFPFDSLQNINMLSQFGLILFMFAIGMELNITEVRQKLKETILISHTSTIFPFFLGMVTAYFLYNKYAYESTPFLSFALFVSIALSITAFPVLARIIQEKGLTKTHLGTISLASAANGDITAWCLLAVVVAIAQAGSMLSAIYNIGFSFIYLLLMFTVIRPFLRMIGHIYHNKEVVDKGLVAFMFLLLIVSSYLTEILGLHALFGAFVAGVVMPDNIKFRKIMTEKVEDVSLALFLPLFFVSTGLRTEIGLLNSPELWYMCGIFILVAIIGKFGGSLVAARFVGETWKDSLYIGALMNTRGLMELVVLTIGYDMKILTPPIFVMLVLMTLVTTFMTTPLISFIQFCYQVFGKYKSHKVEWQQPQPGVFKVLLSFGRASNGQVMLDVAHQMFAHTKDKLEITALHLTVGSDVNPLHTDNFEEVSFGPILYGAQKLNIPLKTRYEVSNNAGQDICEIANKEGYDFLLVGAGISLSDLPNDIAANQYRTSFYDKFLRHFKAPESWFYPGELLKDKTKMFIEQSLCPVGVFVNRKFVKASNTLIVIHFAEDLFLLNYADHLKQTTGSDLTILNLMSNEAKDIDLVTQRLFEYTELQHKAIVYNGNKLTQSVLSAYNFMLISYNTWNLLSEVSNEELQKMPSTLILSK
ncbi:MAG: cation:proton antiporter [Parabacteroides sp.]|uniref:Cation:proton antiporter n=2 Tax=Parabacteroides faecalis TaxID=2924040 RepID=A0ABT0C5X0_9BACT|nr:cation:proton antiporter [Parabacteroides sp.]MCJ2382399.1 cation:proton antiporter [Parabacteroides faecalis]MDD6950796.1 cation:proton antiporter [Parabacteroides sp.]MDD7561495.1 cation:proton antiporter [Parabacteroides sp.]